MGIADRARTDNGPGERIAVQTRSADNRSALSRLELAVASNTWLAAALIFAVTRLVSLAGAYYGVTRLIQAEPERNKGWLAELALMWDSAWYSTIVTGGYQYTPASEGGTNVAFPPLYPFLLKAGSWLLGVLAPGWEFGHPLYGRLIVTGLVLSNVAFFLALVLLMRFLGPRLGRRGAAFVVFALACLPLSFFFSAIYTESLFLMLAVACLMVARSNWKFKWMVASSLGLLMSLLKIAGPVALPVLAVEYMAQRRWDFRKVRWDAAWLALVPVGTAVFIGFLWWRFNNPFAFLDVQSRGWKHEPSFFLVTYWDAVDQLWKSLTHAIPPAEDWILLHGAGNRLYAILDVSLPAILVTGALIARRKLLASEWVWLLLNMIYPLSAGNTNSYSRYIMFLWPGMIWLSLLKGRAKPLAVIWILVSLALLAWCASIYGGARWIG